ncbi:unnamed protein product [Lampetra fluviatilis]
MVVQCAGGYCHRYQDVWPAWQRRPTYPRRAPFSGGRSRLEEYSGGRCPFDPTKGRWPRSKMGRGSADLTHPGLAGSFSPAHEARRGQFKSRAPCPCVTTGSQLESPSKKSTTTLTINGVTFPHPDALCEQTLLKPGEWSYCDYFWSDRKDAQGNAGPSGFEVIVSKQLKGRQMSKEMAEFVRDRRKGPWGEAWSQLKKSLSDEAEVHLKFAAKLHTEVEKPLLSYRENLKKELKKFEHHISEHRKQLLGRLANVDKAKKVLAERQRDLEVKSQQLEIKPTHKTEEDIKKARRKSTQAGDDLMKCVDLYNQTQSKWFEEVVTTSLELERMESSRIEMVQEHLCRYAQLRHETDMFNQSTMEPVDQSLQKVDPTKDRELWIKDHKTGHVQPINMEV